MARIRINDVLKSTISGALFGSLFPFLATIIEVINHNSPLNLSSFFAVQRANPLLWIIDSAIPILGIFGYFVGKKQHQLKQQAASLEECVKDRSKEILERQLFYEALVENSPIAIVTLDSQHNILSANPAFEQIFRFRSKEIIGKNLDELISDTKTSGEARQLTSEVLTGKTIHHTGVRRRSDGTLVDVEILGKPILIDGQLHGVLGLYRDITAEKEARENLEASEARFRSLFQDSPVALRLEDLSDMQRRVKVIQQTFGFSLDTFFESQPKEVTKLLALARILMANEAALALFEMPSLAEFQKNIGFILSPESQKNAISIISALAEGETSIEQELIYQTKDGEKRYIVTRLTILPGHESDWSQVLFSSMDITDRKLAEERMAFISLHDMMTGLYNRVFFDEELARLEKSRVRPITIFVCDMDNLKQINDQYGHKAGDIALQSVADILKQCFREEDMVARIGGDEFSIILPQVASDFAQRIIDRINTCIARHNADCAEGGHLSLSVGYSTAGKSESLIEAFKLADSEMYRKKEKKKKNE